MIFDFLKRKTVKPVDSSHVSGPIGKVKLSEIDTHVPLLQMQYYDPDTEKVLTDEQVTSARRNNKLKPIFYNPNQSIDYIVLEALTKNTIVGPIVNTFTQFLVGTGFSPEIELINPTDDSKKDQETLKKYQSVIDDLKAVERDIEANNDISFSEYITMLIDTTVTFGRGAIIYDDYTKYKNKIATTLKFAHPRDLSITVFNPDSWRLDSVLWQFGGTQTVKADDMIYLFNPLVSAKYHNAWEYGGSMILPMLDAARTLRKIISVDFPAMAEATWAGMFILGIRPTGQTMDKKREEYQAVAEGLVRGAPNILMENPEDMSFNTVDFTPKVNEFKDLTDFLIKYCVATLGLPNSIFIDSGSDRASARANIQLVMATTIEPIRARLSRQINRQTYQKWFEVLHPELKNEIKIRFAWNNLQVSEWYDRIASVLELDGRKQLTDKAFGNLVELPDYLNHVDSKAETNPGGTGEKKHNLQKDNSGKNLDTGKSVNKEEFE